MLEPLDAYIERVDVHQQLVNERQAARETYDRYRAKVRDLGVAGSSKDPARLPRNEQKLANALTEYQVRQAVSWPWVPGSLEPPRQDGENAPKTGKNGEKMGEIRPNKCKGVGITWSAR